MSDVSLPRALSFDSSAAPPRNEELRRTGAARDFEALLVSQMLRSVREEGSGWLGTGEDDASSAAFGLGEEQLARALTAGGGFGLTRVIDAGLQTRAASSSAPQPASE